MHGVPRRQPASACSLPERRFSAALRCWGRVPGSPLRVLALRPAALGSVIPKHRDGLTRLSLAREDHKPILGHLVYVLRCAALRGSSFLVSCKVHASAHAQSARE